MKSSLIAAGLLKDSSVESWEVLIERTCAKGIIGHVAPNDIQILDLEFDLSLQHLAVATKKSGRK